MKLKSIDDADGHSTTGFYWHHGPGFMLKTSDKVVDVLYSETESKFRTTQYRFLAVQWHKLNWKDSGKKIGCIGKKYSYYDGHYIYSFYILKLNFSFGYTWCSTPVIS